jgi:hypothetical protein
LGRDGAGEAGFMKRTELVGILTIIAGTICIVSPNSLSGWIWGGLRAFDLDIIAVVMWGIGILLGVLGLTVGVATLMKKKWAWKANFALQVVLVPLLASAVIADFSVLGRFLSLVFFPTNTVLMFAIAIAVLLLLSRPNTRAAYFDRS